MTSVPLRVILCFLAAEYVDAVHGTPLSETKIKNLHP